MAAFQVGFLVTMLGGQERDSSGSRADTTLQSPLPPNLWTRAQGEDWPCFLGPRGDGTSSEKGLLAPWPAEGPRVVWQRKTGTGYGIGCISRGRYFHFEGDDHFEGEERTVSRGRGVARLVCLNAETGERQWRYEYPCGYQDMLGYDNGPRSSPLVDGDRVYALGPAGILHCLDAHDGSLRWKCNTTEKYQVVQNFFGVGSTPVIVGNLLICIVGGSPEGSPGLYESSGHVEGNGSGIVAFDKFTGEVKYEITDELASYSTPKLATDQGRQWCFILARGGLVAFDPTNGKVDFQYPWRASKLESVNASTPVVVGNEVFISECYQIGSSLLSFRPGSFALRWKDERLSRRKSMRAHWNTPIHINGYVYGCSGRNSSDADLRCIEWKTGKMQWQHRDEFPERSTLMYVDRHFVYLGEFGRLRLIKANPKQYEVISEVELTLPSTSSTTPLDATEPLLRYPCWAAPILSHGLLYVRSKGRLVCLELIPGKAANAQPASE